MAQRSTTPDDNSNEYAEILKAVGTRFREARQKAGLTQAQLGVKADIKQSYIFELETGGANPTLRTLAKMADVLGMNIRDLLPESRSAGPTTAGIDLLCGLFEKIAAILGERETSAARREAQDAELLAEIRAFSDLRFALEESAHSHHHEGAAPSSGSGRERQKRRDRPSQ